MLILILFVFSHQDFTKAEELHWELMHQTDYDVIPHRIEIIYFNKSYGEFTRCDMVKYNRTYERTLNATGTLIKPLDGKRLVAKVQLYKFVSNTYKFFPITVDVNLCDEFERNSFNIKTMLGLYTNIHSCPPKLGFLYGTYVPMDFSKFPPFIPRGDYKDKIVIYSGDDKFIHLEAYGSVVDKPKKWK